PATQDCRLPRLWPRARSHRPVQQCKGYQGCTGPPHLSEREGWGMKLTPVARRYLEAVADWSAPYEVASRFGWPESSGEKVKPYLGRLIGEGLVTWSRA